MNATWLIAKYMGDLRRREPRNVGVVLFTAEGVYTKFKGEDLAGIVDGRRVVNNVGSVDNYRAWIAHWKAAVAKGKDAAELVAASPRQNYFLEWGGERLLGNDQLDPDQFILQLYRELVEDEPAPIGGVAEVSNVIERTFARLRIANKIVQSPTLIVDVGGVDDHVVFDYGYQNGVQSYMKQVRIGRNNPWEGVHAAVWSYARARQQEENCRLVSLVTCAPNVDSAGPTNLLGSTSELVVIGDEDATVKSLAAALRLS